MTNKDFDLDHKIKFVITQHRDYSKTAPRMFGLCIVPYILGVQVCCLFQCQKYHAFSHSRLQNLLILCKT